MSRYPKFDRSQITIHPSKDRESKVTIGDIIQPAAWLNTVGKDVPIDTETAGLADAILAAQRAGRPVVLFLSGHVIKHGLSQFVIDLMQQGVVTHVAANGSVAIHDYELAAIMQTSEDVGKYIGDGRFGHWSVPGGINDIVNAEFTGTETIGEMLGKRMQQHQFGLRNSVIRNAYELGIPCTFHTLVGGDIIHQHPNCSHSMFAASYEDFLCFARTIQDLNGGVFINVGSQVTGTEVFLKALSMARNVATGRGLPPIHDITTAMADFVQLPPDWRTGEASEGEAAYYYRPWKTVLLRAIADGGRSFYLGGPHTTTVPKLWKSLTIQSEV